MNSIRIGYSIEDGRTDIYTEAHPSFQYSDGYVDAPADVVARYVTARLEMQKALHELMPVVVADLQSKRGES